MNRKKDYRDMEKYREARNRQKRRYYGKTAHKYGSRRWTQEEKEIILRHELTDMKISRIIKRSVAAIQCKRSLLKGNITAKTAETVGDEKVIAL